MISRPDPIPLSTPVKNVEKVDGYFRRELDYLIGEKGFKLSEDGFRLVK